MRNVKTNVIRISPFNSFSVCFLARKGSNATPFKTRSRDLMTCCRLSKQKIACERFGASV